MSAIGPGDRVECIEEGWGRHGGEICPVKTGIYTVRDLTSGGIPGGAWAGIRLKEIINPPKTYRSGYAETFFALSHFRPIDERTTDIEIFREIDREVGRRHYRHIPDEELVT